MNIRRKNGQNSFFRGLPEDSDRMGFRQAAFAAEMISISEKMRLYIRKTYIWTSDKIMKRKKYWAEGMLIFPLPYIIIEYAVYTMTVNYYGRKAVRCK